MYSIAKLNVRMNEAMIFGIKKANPIYHKIQKNLDAAQEENIRIHHVVDSMRTQMIRKMKMG